MRPRVEQANLLLLERELLRRPMSAYDAAEFLGIDVRNARPYMKLIRDPIRVSRWVNRGRGPWVPVYEYGDEPDAPRPRRLTGVTRKLRSMTFGGLFT